MSDDAKLEKFGLWLLENQWINTRISSDGSITHYQSYAPIYKREHKTMKDLVDLFNQSTIIQ